MQWAQLVFLLVAFIGVSGRATDSSESKSASSSRSSSSEEINYNEQAELLKVHGNDENSTLIDAVKDTETAGKTDLGKFDEAIEEDKKLYVGKRAQERKSDKADEEDMEIIGNLNSTLTDEDDRKSNETVLGIDTFGAQGI